MFDQKIMTDALQGCAQGTGVDLLDRATAVSYTHLTLPTKA